MLQSKTAPQERHPGLDAALAAFVADRELHKGKAATLSMMAHSAFGDLVNWLIVLPRKQRTHAGMLEFSKRYIEGRSDGLYATKLVRDLLLADFLVTLSVNPVFPKLMAASVRRLRVASSARKKLPYAH